MASKTNRNLQRKHELSKRQVREAAHMEYTKACYLSKHEDVAIPADFPVRKIATGLTMSRLLRSHW